MVKERMNALRNWQSLNGVSVQALPSTYVKAMRAQYDSPALCAPCTSIPSPGSPPTPPCTPFLFFFPPVWRISGKHQDPV